MLVYLESQRKAGQQETFNFGLYGKDIQYTSQPLLSGLLENEWLLLTIIPDMKQTHRKSTIVRDSFLAVIKRYKNSKVNVSSYSDSVWSRWCCHSAILLVEHIHKLASQPRVLRQVLQQDNSGDMKQRLDKLVDLWVGSGEDGAPPKVPIKKEFPAVKQEPADDDRESTWTGRSPGSSSSGRRSVLTCISSYESFAGGSALKACLMLQADVGTAASEEEQDPNTI